jgi:phosphatidylglycerol---prolipoprotein diacylglyceryl transferase
LVWHHLPCGFFAVLLLARSRLQHAPYASLANRGIWKVQHIDDLMTYGVLGVVLGGRIGYCLFYQPSYYAAHPLEIAYIWQGGMSFHGGMLGVISAMAIAAWRRKRPWLEITDFIAPCVPTGLAAGRLGNFINGELWGRAASADLPWAMVFPQSGSDVPRHPSQIYQFLLEGLLLFVVLWWLARKPRPTGWISGVFCWVMAVFVLLPSISASPMHIWVCCPWACRWGSGYASRWYWQVRAWLDGLVKPPTNTI